jgi:hypothetical protein
MALGLNYSGKEGKRRQRRYNCNHFDTHKLLSMNHAFIKMSLPLETIKTKIRSKWVVFG